MRSVYDIEFTEGGHEHVHAYIPRGEVWIDDDIHENEREFVLFHELHERNLIADGMDYDTAHDESSKLEKHYQRHPDELHEALAREVGSNPLPQCVPRPDSQLTRPFAFREVIARIERFNAGREPERLALKYRETRKTSFAFFRGL